MLEGAAEQALTPSLAEPALQRPFQGLERVRAGPSLERVDHPREHGAELTEDHEVAGCDQQRDVVHDVSDKLEDAVVVDGRALADPRQRRIRARKGDVKRREPSEQDAEGGWNLVLADEPAGGARRPRGEGAPICVLAVEHSRELRREVVVALRDQEVPANGIGVEADNPVDPLKRRRRAGRACSGARRRPRAR